MTKVDSRILQNAVCNTSLFFKDNALACLRNKDLTVFTDVVNQGGRGKGDDAEKGGGGGDFPLPGDHWINRALEDEDDQTLLEAAIERGLHDFQVSVFLFAQQIKYCT